MSEHGSFDVKHCLKVLEIVYMPFTLHGYGLILLCHHVRAILQLFSVSDLNWTFFKLDISDGIKVSDEVGLVAFTCKVRSRGSFSSDVFDFVPEERPQIPNAVQVDS